MTVTVDEWRGTAQFAKLGDGHQTDPSLEIGTSRPSSSVSAHDV